MRGFSTSLGINGVSTLDPLDEGYPEFVLSGYVNFGDEDDLPETRETTWFDIESVFIYNFSDPQSELWIGHRRDSTGQQPNGRGSAEVDSFTMDSLRATLSQIFCWEFPTLQNAAWVPIATTCDVLTGRSLSRTAGK